MTLKNGEPTIPISVPAQEKYAARQAAAGAVVAHRTVDLHPEIDLRSEHHHHVPEDVTVKSLETNGVAVTWATPHVIKYFRSRDHYMD